ncbi:serine hydrolase domain-containing protein [Haloimpatiens sp. FM7330]|uniref:serine hydrolase domain-containing protein n=1 Tax=Haloimpatiens sp. FM7330 TaxID=3298610 RepID=UPI00362E1FBB
MKNINTKNAKIFSIIIKSLIFFSVLFLLILFIRTKILADDKAHITYPNDRNINLDANDSFPNNIKEIEKLIGEKMSVGKIPGLSVAIVHGDNIIYKSGFGYADLESSKLATSQTLYELGSNSKAFTALGILQLEKDGLIHLNDSITKYIPWLKTKFKGNIATITIEELLHHTSGISADTIFNIPVTTGKDAIKQTVKTLVGVELDNKPGDKYQYATINYDVLGLLIEKVSGQKYEDYIKDKILTPMKMNQTYMYRNQIDGSNMSKGYKLFLRKPKKYEAPIYDGNKPAGYIISNINDMAKWLLIQMNSLPTSSFDSSLINASHIPNKSVQPFGNGMNYAAGWIIRNNKGLEILHRGSNPNYSSSIIIRPHEKLGIVLLSNSNTFYSSTMCEEIMNILLKKTSTTTKIKDLNGMIDKICSIIILITTLLICFKLYNLIKIIKQLFFKKRGFQFKEKKTVIKIIFSTIFLVLINYALYILPYVLLKIKWNYIFVWYPFTIQIALYFIYFSIWLVYIVSILKSGSKCISN